MRNYDTMAFMPITKGAKKALRSSKKKSVFNLRRKRAMASVIKQTRKLTEAGKFAEAKELLPSIYKAIDKAAKGGVIKKNTAARKKSHFSTLLKNQK